MGQWTDGVNHCGFLVNGWTGAGWRLSTAFSEGIVLVIPAAGRVSETLAVNGFEPVPRPSQLKSSAG